MGIAGSHSTCTSMHRAKIRERRKKMVKGQRKRVYPKDVAEVIRTYRLAFTIMSMKKRNEFLAESVLARTPGVTPYKSSSLRGPFAMWKQDGKVSYYNKPLKITLMDETELRSVLDTADLPAHIRDAFVLPVKPGHDVQSSEDAQTIETEEDDLSSRDERPLEFWGVVRRLSDRDPNGDAV
jgi:hypothetical protein